MGDGAELLFRAVEKESLADLERSLGTGHNSVNERHMELDGQTPLHIAAAKGNMEMVKTLVEKYSANLDLEDLLGEVAVHKAADAGHLSIVSYLVSKKCKYAEDVEHLVGSTGDAQQECWQGSDHKAVEKGDECSGRPVQDGRSEGAVE